MAILPGGGGEYVGRENASSPLTVAVLYSLYPIMQEDKIQISFLLEKNAAGRLVFTVLCYPYLTKAAGDSYKLPAGII